MPIRQLEDGAVIWELTRGDVEAGALRQLANPYAPAPVMEYPVNYPVEPGPIIEHYYPPAPRDEIPPPMPPPIIVTPAPGDDTPPPLPKRSGCADHNYPAVEPPPGHYWQILPDCRRVAVPFGTEVVIDPPPPPPPTNGEARPGAATGGIPGWLIGLGIVIGALALLGGSRE